MRVTRRVGGVGAFRRFASVLLLCLASQVAARAAEVAPGAPGADYRPALVMKPGELSGTVLRSDGKTPVAAAPVRVWSVGERKFVQETVTDEKGAYRLQALPVGRYLVLFADRVVVDLRVDEAAESAGGPLNVIVPRGTPAAVPMPMATGMAMLASLGPAGRGWPHAGFPLRTLVLMGAGTVTAVGVAFVIENNLGESDGHVVSP